MDYFTIAFLNLPVSKDDSFIGLPQAELIHATVESSNEGSITRYFVEPLSQQWQEELGRIELSKSADDHWKLESGKELVEGIFPRIIQAIEDVESAAKDKGKGIRK